MGKKSLDFDTYQKFTSKTAVYPAIGKKFVYPALGLAGETGEVLEKIKKIFRDEKGRLTKEKKLELKKELGDVLWYLTQLSLQLGFSLSEVAEENVNKLTERQKQGKLKGSGDNR